MVELPFRIEFGDFRVIVENFEAAYRWFIVPSGNSHVWFKDGLAESVESAIAEAFTFLDLENY